MSCLKQSAIIKQYNFAFSAGKCVDVPFGQYYNACIDLGFSQSAFPNYNLDINFPSHNMMLEVITYLQKTTQCYKHSQLFGCSVFVPKCSGTEVVFQHAIPPCRSLCEGGQCIYLLQIQCNVDGQFFENSRNNNSKYWWAFKILMYKIYLSIWLILVLFLKMLGNASIHTWSVSIKDINISVHCIHRYFIFPF